MVIAIIWIMLAVLWLGGVCWLFVQATEAFETGGVRDLKSWVLAVSALLAFAVPLGAVLGAPDPHAKTLCESGHEEWHFNGKSTSKRWTCDKWENGAAHER